MNPLNTLSLGVHNQKEALSYQICDSDNRPITLHSKILTEVSHIKWIKAKSIKKHTGKCDFGSK